MAYEYTPRGQLCVTRSDVAPGGSPVQQVVDQRFDERGRPTHATFGEAPFRQFENVTTFDQVGMLTSTSAAQDKSVVTVTRTRQSQTLEQDDLGRITTITNSAGDTIGEVTLDLAGRTTKDKDT